MLMTTPRGMFCWASLAHLPLAHLPPRQDQAASSQTAAVAAVGGASVVSPTSRPTHLAVSQRATSAQYLPTTSSTSGTPRIS